MDDQSRRKFQSLAKLSLEKALKKNGLIKGKAVSLNPNRNPWFCVMDGCTSTFDSDVELLNHLMLGHGMDDRFLANITWDLKRDYIMKGIRARHKQGIMATGRRCFPLLRRFVFGGGGEDEKETNFVFEDVFVYHRMRSNDENDPI